MTGSQSSWKSCCAAPMPISLRNLLTPRFSLRALLVVVTVGCVVIGWRANRLWTNQRAIESLRQNDLFVRPTFETKADTWLSFWSRVDIEQVAISGKWPFLPDPEKPYQPVATLWKNLSLMAPLRNVGIMGVDVPDDLGGNDGIDLEGVTQAQFTLCRFRHEALRIAIERMPHLRLLDLDACEIELPKSGSLLTCRQLEEVSLKDESASANVISMLRHAPLRAVRLARASFNMRPLVSEEDINTLSEMPHLEELSLLGGTGPSLTSIRQLKKCKNLKSLRLELTNLSPEDLAVIRIDFAKVATELQARTSQLFGSLTVREFYPASHHASRPHT